MLCTKWRHSDWPAQSRATVNVEFWNLTPKGPHRRFYNTDALGHYIRYVTLLAIHSSRRTQCIWFVAWTFHTVCLCFDLFRLFSVIHVRCSSCSRLLIDTVTIERTLAKVTALNKNVVILTKCSLLVQNDNFQCSQWCKCHQNEDSSLSKIASEVTMTVMSKIYQCQATVNYNLHIR